MNESLVSVPSWWQAPLSDEAPEAFIIKIVNLGGERESLFLGGFLIFVWSAPHGLVVVGIHDNHNPPTIGLITSDADLDGVLLHVGFVQVDCRTDGTDCPLSGAATIAVMLCEHRTQLSFEMPDVMRGSRAKAGRASQQRLPPAIGQIRAELVGIARVVGAPIDIDQTAPFELAALAAELDL